MSATSVSTVQAYHHGDLRRALLRASLQLLRKKSPEALTLREVARMAGVSHAAPYRHFQDKEALIAAVAEQGFVRLARSIDKATEVDAPLSQRFKAGALAYIRFAQKSPGHFKVMFAQNLQRAGQQQAQQLADEIFEQILRLVQEFKTQNSHVQGLAARAEPREVARIAWATLHGLAQLGISGQISLQGKSELEHLAELSIDNLLFGCVDDSSQSQKSDSQKHAGRRTKVKKSAHGA